MQVKRYNYTVALLLIVLCTAGVPLSALAEENVTPGVKVEAAPAQQPQVEKKAVLTLNPVSEKVLGVDLSNTVPVRGVQFTVSGVAISELRTTKRTAGFLAKFNEKNGKAIILSTSGASVAPGKGAIAEIICDKPSAATLSEVQIAGENRERL